MRTFSIYYQSPIGLLKIAGTESYITEVTFAKANTTMPLAQDEDIPIILHQCVEELIEYFNGARRIFSIPVNQEGTEFQQRVWNELPAIGFGKTISYLDLARRLGDAKAIRAVASTNSKNKIMIIVPCHRVIGTNRSLVGYAGGLWRKKCLLDHEVKIAYGVQTLF